MLSGVVDSPKPERHVSEQELRDYLMARDRLPQELADYISAERQKQGSRIARWFDNAVRQLRIAGEAIDGSPLREEDPNDNR